jgi:hypothetical protein
MQFVVAGFTEGKSTTAKRFQSTSPKHHMIPKVLLAGTGAVQQEDDDEEEGPQLKTLGPGDTFGEVGEGN